MLHPRQTSAFNEPKRNSGQKPRILPVVLLLLLAALLLLRLHGIPCPIKWFTGISCPGCGMTRAFRCALRLDFPAAFGFHPLFFTVPLIFPLAALRKRFPRAVKAVLWLLIAAFFTVYLYRLFEGTSSVVVWAPRSGFLYRAAATLLNLVRTRMRMR